MAIEQLCEKEISLLRNELASLKDCQFKLLTYSVTASGVILSLAVNASSGSNPPSIGTYYLIPLTILLPFMWIFFDKATTITRIVGYYRFLENFTIEHHGSTQKFIGWENALARYRERQRSGNLTYTPDRNTLSGHLEELWFLIVLRTTHRYWILTYYIFLAVSLVCLVIGSVGVVSDLHARLAVCAALAGAVGRVWNRKTWNLALLSPVHKLLRRSLIVSSFILLGWVGLDSLPITSSPQVSDTLAWVAIYLTTFSAIWNFYMVWQLVRGYYSYDATQSYWDQILTLDSISTSRS